MAGGIEERLNSALEGRYRIERELGRGGMAMVFLARDAKHHRLVAIKVLRPDLTELVERERFTREIEIAAGLHHPNVLGLHDSGSGDGLHWFVMPYVEGDSLRDLLERRGTLPVDDAVRYAREVGEALAYAHDRGLVHRDVKPENVLFQVGHPVVCDFGIAKAVSGARDRLTRTGMSVGTLSYMAPEQLSEDGEVDARADVYALGCLLYEMLEGSPPFRASTPQASIGLKLVGEVPSAPSRSDVPKTVWDVVRQALAVDPSQRFASADAFVAALNYANTDLAVEREKRRRRRDRFGRGLGAVAVVAAVLAGGMFIANRATRPHYERLAVLPLDNGSGDPREDFYVRGLHEDFVEEMQRAGLRVINPSSIRRAAEAGGSLAEIAERLGVDGVVEGSVERIGPRVVVDLRLADGASEELLWSGSFAAAQLDVVGLLRNMTRSVAEEIDAALTPEAEARLQEATRIDGVLYELLLQARYEAWKLTEEGLDDAQAYYERAIARDSMSVDAWNGLISIWGLRAQQGLVSAQEARTRREEILQASPVEGLDPDAAGRALTATWFDWPDARWAEAEEAFVAALEQNPGDAATRAYYAVYLLYMDRDEEGAREAERAAAQAPDDPLVQALYGQVLNALHRYDEAEEALNWARRFDPEAPVLLSTLRTTHHLQGEEELAIQSWRDSYVAAGDQEALAALNRGYERGGYATALQSVAELFEARRAEGEYVTPWQVGTLYTRAGVPDRAVEYLALAVEEGDFNCPYLSIDPIFDPMRSDPEFQALVEQLRLPG